MNELEKLQAENDERGLREILEGVAKLDPSCNYFLENEGLYEKYIDTAIAEIRSLVYEDSGILNEAGSWGFRRCRDKTLERMGE